MPDASGRIRGIAVPRIPWHEDPRPPKPEVLPNEKRDTRAKLK